MKPFKPLPSREYLLNTFTYDNGKLLWKVPPSNTTIQVGDEAGWLEPRGWRSVRTNGGMFKVHRIIYEMCVGGLTTTDEIDHINRVRDDNRIENLRPATRQQQADNRTDTINNGGKMIENGTLTAKGREYYRLKARERRNKLLMEKYRTLVNTDGSLV